MCGGLVHEDGQSTDRPSQLGPTRVRRARRTSRTRVFRVLLVSSAVGIAPLRAFAADVPEAAPDATPPVPGPAATAAPAPSPKKPPLAPPKILPPEAPHDLRSPAEPAHVDQPVDYTTRRYEPAGFPLVAYNSDVGFQFGAVSTLSYFSSGIQPYAWNMDLFALISVKSGPNGAEIAQQNYQWNIDYPAVFGSKLRLNPQVAFTRTVNEGYFGLGNASSGAPAPPGIPNQGLYHQYLTTVAYARTLARYDLKPPLALMGALTYRYVNPVAYAGSKLADDESVRQPSGAPLLYGTTPLSLASLAAGIVVDSRDNEIFTNRGVYHQIGVRYEQGLPFSQNVQYIEAGAVLSAFVPLVGPLVLAGRFIADFQVLHVPFFDLSVAGPFQLKDLPGGSTGIRGVPIGRYLGPIKVVGNVELRALLLKVTIAHQNFRLGGDLFMDAGRIWSDYTFRSPLDGSGIGIKWGTGGGIYLLWGQAAIFRIEAAYSPDARSAGGLPFGLYVEDGTMF